MQVPTIGKGFAFEVNGSPTIEAVKALLVRDIPVEVGIFVYNSYRATSDWRYDSRVDKRSNLIGGHAIQLVGFTTSGSQTIFTFKNSWGLSWGNAGYGTIDDGILAHSWSKDRNFDFIVSMHD
ncbi:MAG: hypothetical protein H7328_00850 [Bdellovibrio sp.]|nr:hypothetical protein [Bdellovibrio sp.]